MNENRVPPSYIKYCRFEFCNKEFIARRTNQEYCCVEHKTIQNNLLRAKPLRDATKYIDGLLHKNYLILKKLHEDDRETFHKVALRVKRYNIDYCTKCEIDNEGRLKKTIYDFELIELKNNNFKLSKMLLTYPVGK